MKLSRGRRERLRLKRKRQRLYDANNFCIFCGVKMIMPDVIPRNSGGLSFYPDNMVTLEHLITKWDPMRRHPKPGENRIIICCNKCNSERGEIARIKFMKPKNVRKYKTITQIIDG